MQPGIRVRLPKTVTSEAVKYENVEILVSKDNNIYLNGKIINADELRVLFKPVAKRNQSIMLKADKLAPLGKVVEIWDIARDSGITQINLATNQ